MGGELSTWLWTNSSLQTLSGAFTHTDWHVCAWPSSTLLKHSYPDSNFNWTGQCVKKNKVTSSIYLLLNCKLPPGFSWSLTLLSSASELCTHCLHVLCFWCLFVGSNVCVILSCFSKDHFEHSQFEEIARSPAGGKKLKPNAIPTLFSIGDPPYPAVTTPFILLPMKPEPGNCSTWGYL